MAELTSTSTIADAITEYKETAGYRRAGSSSLAYRHSEAIAHILAHPTRSQVASSQWSMSDDALVAAKAAAESWAASKARTGGGFVRADLSQVRRFG